LISDYGNADFSADYSEDYSADYKYSPDYYKPIKRWGNAPKGREVCVKFYFCRK
jgi:hypothetical protein